MFKRLLGKKENRRSLSLTKNQKLEQINEHETKKFAPEVGRRITSLSSTPNDQSDDNLGENRESSEMSNSPSMEVTKMATSRESKREDSKSFTMESEDLLSKIAELELENEKINSEKALLELEKHNLYIQSKRAIHILSQVKKEVELFYEVADSLISDFEMENKRKLKQRHEEIQEHIILAGHELSLSDHSNHENEEFSFEIISEKAEGEAKNATEPKKKKKKNWLRNTKSIAPEMKHQMIVEEINRMRKSLSIPQEKLELEQTRNSPNSFNLRSTHTSTKILTRNSESKTVKSSSEAIQSHKKSSQFSRRSSRVFRASLDPILNQTSPTTFKLKRINSTYFANSFSVDTNDTEVTTRIPSSPLEEKEDLIVENLSLRKQVESLKEFIKNNTKNGMINDTNNDAINDTINDPIIDIISNDKNKYASKSTSSNPFSNSKTNVPSLFVAGSRSSFSGAFRPSHLNPPQNSLSLGSHRSQPEEPSHSKKVISPKQKKITHTFTSTSPPSPSLQQEDLVELPENQMEMMEMSERSLSPLILPSCFSSFSCSC